MNSNQIQSREIEPLPLLQKSRSVEKLQNYQDKFFKALEVNAKLKQLFQTITNNNLARKIEMSKVNENEADDQQVVRLKKKEIRLTSQIQQLTNSLNILTSENNKLKAQVNNSRNSRVIYSNVYKTIQKQIRKHEYLYKLAIIDYLSYQEVDNKVNQKINALTRKLEKDINELQGKIKPMKKDKYKGRINTGLSTFRGSKLDSKDTNRNSMEGGKISNRDKREDVILQIEPVTKKQAHQVRICNDKQKTEIGEAFDKDRQLDKNKMSRSKSKIPTEHLLNNDYELLMKSNYYSNVYKQLREICEVESLPEMVNVWKDAQGSVDKEYTTYLQLQDKLKQIYEQQLLMQKQRISLPTKEETPDKTQQEQQLQRLEQEFLSQTNKMSQYESKLTELMDLNCHKLSDDQIHQHILRMKRRGEATTRELQRMLENVSKDKASTQNLILPRISDK